jgi:hypothetical protein
MGSKRPLQRANSLGFGTDHSALPSPDSLRVGDQVSSSSFPSPGHPCGRPAPVFSTGIQDQGCHPRYLQRFRRSLSTSPFPARSSPARTSPPAFRPAARCPEGCSLVPRRALRPHPGVEVSLAFSLDPAPHGFRFGVRAIPAVPTHGVRFYPDELESACASYPARRPAYRSAWRVATSSSTCPVPVT